MGITLNTERTDPGGIKEAPPAWVCTLQLTAENNQDKISSCSDGMYSANNFTVVRQREGTFHSDGARWSRGFTSGKHVFTIVYPEAHRGTEASVGVGLMTAPLYAKGRVTLVGLKSSSWGVDLRTKRAVHAGKVVKKYPQTQIPLPDMFDMYLDMDSGTLQFSSEEGFHGTAITGIKMKTGGDPVYPMVSAVTPGATINMTYKGEAIDPMMHQLQQQQVQNTYMEQQNQYQQQMAFQQQQQQQQQQQMAYQQQQQQQQQQQPQPQQQQQQQQQPQQQQLNTEHQPDQQVVPLVIDAPVAQEEVAVQQTQPQDVSHDAPVEPTAPIQDTPAQDPSKVQDQPESAAPQETAPVVQDTTNNVAPLDTSTVAAPDTAPPAPPQYTA